MRSDRLAWPKLLIAVMLAAGCGLLLGAVIRVSAQQASDPPPPVSLILALDDSPSMGSADAQRLRLRAASYLLDYAETQAIVSSAPFSVSIVRFGRSLADQPDLRPLPDPQLRERIRSGVMPDTDFVAPLSYAVNQFEKLSPGPRGHRAIILFTDGEPGRDGAPLTGITLTNYFRGAEPGSLTDQISRLRQQEAEVFVVALGNLTQFKPYWTELIGEDNYIAIGPNSDLPAVMRDIMASILGSDALRMNPLPRGREIAIELEPFWEEVIFAFLKSNPTAVITVTDPAGAVVPPDGPAPGEAYSQVFRVANPPGGRWRIAWQGPGRVEWDIKKVAPTVPVELEAPNPIVGQPITVTVILQLKGDYIPSVSDVKVVVLRPDSSALIEPLMPAAETGRFWGIVSDTNQPGLYSVTGVVVNGIMLQVPPDRSVQINPQAPPITPTAVRVTDTPTPTTTPVATSTTTPTATPLSAAITAPTAAPTATSERPGPPEKGSRAIPVAMWIAIGFVLLFMGAMMFLGILLWRKYGQFKR